MNEYLDNIISLINLDAIRERDLRIAIDPMYGVSLTALCTILSIARCTAVSYTHLDLFGADLREGRPCDHRIAAGHEGAYRSDQRFLQGLCHDRMASGLCLCAGSDLRTDAEDPSVCHLSLIHI